MNRAQAKIALASRDQAPHSLGRSRRDEASALPLREICRGIAWALLVGGLVFAGTRSVVLAFVSTVAIGATWDV